MKLTQMQFDPSPRRGEANLAKKTPDYFLWDHAFSLSNSLAMIFGLINLLAHLNKHNHFIFIVLVSNTIKVIRGLIIIKNDIKL